MNKRKIINDPVHGFIKIPFDLIHTLIEHPYVQRLRQIKQLGLSHLVYPGSMHTRFQHALGAMHLVSSAVETLRAKGHFIAEEESKAVHAAILLHDLGHGPFSHVLENSLVEVPHEALSHLMMSRLNKELDGALSMAIDIFNDDYHKHFLHQLVSSQLDMDRLDYLKRDSFFSGVSEGTIGSDRIIKMLNVANDKLVVESKGIYSIEKFLVARRLMYWQVYLHKTSLVAEQMLVHILKRAKQLVSQGEFIFAPPQLHYFLKKSCNQVDFEESDEALIHYVMLDDNDIISSIKTWSQHDDPILSTLSNAFINRRLWAIKIDDKPFKQSNLNYIRDLLVKHYQLKNQEDANYFLFSNYISNNAYSPKDEKIEILFNNKQLKDITEASDMLNLSVLGKTDRKHYLCYPKWIDDSLQSIK